MHLTPFFLLLNLLLFLLFFSPQQSGGQTFAKPDIVVAQDGSGGFLTVKEALEMAQRITGRSGRLVIYVKAGVYHEKVAVARTLVNLTMVGDGIGKTVITSNRSAATDASGYFSATFSAHGDGFMATGITFQNTYGPTSQAVAMMTRSDRSVYYKCSFEGYQDTLYAHSGRQFFRECHIYGTVDFIYGEATAVFQQCDIYLRKPLQGQSNTITAQGRSHPYENSGIVIQFCNIMAASELMPMLSAAGHVKSYLGRPWHEYARVIYLENYIDGVIDPRGWTTIDGDFALNTSYFGEFGNRGPGSDVSKRVKWLGYHVFTQPSTVEQFTVGRFIDGHSWIPSTGVPFISDT